jgi:hypothetical protein
MDRDLPPHTEQARHALLPLERSVSTARDMASLLIVGLLGFIEKARTLSGVSLAARMLAFVLVDQFEEC